MIILAIDLGKFNSMCCFYDTATQKYRFQRVVTTRHYLTSVFKHEQIDLRVEAGNRHADERDGQHDHQRMDQRLVRTVWAQDAGLQHE